MEIFFAPLVKLTTIFFGSGLLTLFAFCIAKEISLIPKFILDFEIEKKKIKDEKLTLTNYQKVSSQSGTYEVLIPGSKPIKLFSSHEGIKILG